MCIVLVFNICLYQNQSRGDTMAEKMAAVRLVLDSKDFSAIMYFDIMSINLQGPT